MPKDEVVVIRVSEAGKASMVAKALSEDRTLGGWARRVLEREAGVEREAVPDVGRRTEAGTEGVGEVKRQGAKLKPGVEEAVQKQQARKRRPGERCPHCNKKACKGECW